MDSNVNSNGKILIIDDDPDMQIIYSETLKNAGYNIDQAKDGEEGLTKLLQGGYDLILLDIMMPKIDGLAILKKIHQSDQTGYNGAIIVLSALNNPELVNQALQLGAKGYIVKSSISPDQLVDRVAEILASKAP